LDASKNLDSLEGYQNAGPYQNTTGTLKMEPSNHDGSETNMLDLETSMKNKHGATNGHYNLQPRNERPSSKWSNEFLFGFATTQNNINQGLNFINQTRTASLIKGN